MIPDNQYKATLPEMQQWAADIMASREPDLIIGNNQVRRWWVLPRNHWSNLYLHEINSSDEDRAGHDHPWASTSFIIEGSYYEAVYSDDRPWIEVARYRRQAGDVVSRRAEDTHRLIMPNGGRAVSLFSTGAIVRDWGFWDPNGPKWVPHDEFCVTANGRSTVRP